MRNPCKSVYGDSIGLRPEWLETDEKSCAPSTLVARDLPGSAEATGLFSRPELGCAKACLGSVGLAAG